VPFMLLIRHSRMGNARMRPRPSVTVYCFQTEYGNWRDKCKNWLWRARVTNVPEVLPSVVQANNGRGCEKGGDDRGISHGTDQGALREQKSFV